MTSMTATKDQINVYIVDYNIYILWMFYLIRWILIFIYCIRKLLSHIEADACYSTGCTAIYCCFTHKYIYIYNEYWRIRKLTLTINQYVYLFFSPCDWCNHICYTFWSTLCIQYMSLEIFINWKNKPFMFSAAGRQMKYLEFISNVLLK